MSASTLQSKSIPRLILAASGIILVALNLRTSVVSVSPIYGRIAHSFPLTATAQGVLGTLPLLAFAAFGWAGPRLARRVGLERGLMIAMLMVCIGDLARAYLSNSAWVFGILSVVCLGGMGIANVLLPAAIKQYFPRSIGVMTSTYLVLIAISASAPAMIAVPMTNVLGWRFAVAIWAALGLLAALPWLGMVSRDHQAGHGPARTSFKVWRWPTAWAVTILFAVGAMDMYALIAWMPTLLVSSAGVAAVTAGVMLSIYNFIGFPHSLLVPVILAKTRRPVWVVAFATICLVSGTLGLGYAPHWAWIWIFPAGLGAMFVPIGLTLINLRTKTQEGTTALSGFVQSAGYLVAAMGPVIVGYLHTVTHGWIASCWFMAIAGLVAGAAGVIATRTVYLEDR